MSSYTQSIQNLMNELAALPGIGARSAERIAFHLLKQRPEEAMKLAEAIRDVKTRIRHCSVCFNLTESDPCNICADASRDHGLVCVVEQPKDLLALEATGLYQGVYHVLLGRISPLEGIHPEDYREVVFQDTSANVSFVTRSTVKTEKTIVWEDGKEYPLYQVAILYGARRQLHWTPTPNESFFINRMSWTD